MSVKVDISHGTGELILRFPARTWELAHDVVEALRDNPPEGYRLDQSWLRPRGRSGRRCNMRLSFVVNDDRITPLATSGAKAYFEPFALQAQGVEE